MISKYILIKNEQYQKCFNNRYFESCKIAKENADNPLNTCDNLDWDAQTRFNVGIHCQQLVNYKPFNNESKEIPSKK